MKNIERNYKLDLLRVIAIMMIILMHSPMPKSAPGFVLVGISYFTAPGIGLFFMISGALLLGNNMNTSAFLKKRFTKIVFPTIFWTFFYMTINHISHPYNLSDGIKKILSIPFTAQGHGVLWFMYTLAGLYLVTPILSKWLRTATRKEVEFYLFLWGISLLYPYLSQLFFIDKSPTGILYYFTGYVGYFLLGYYMNTYSEIRIIQVVIAAVFALMIPVILYGSVIEFDFYSVLWYLSLPVASMAFVWFYLINRSSNNTMKWISEFSRLSFGIYLVHIFVMRDVLWKIGLIISLPGLLQIPIIAIVTFGISFLVVKVLTYLPYSKYIVGV